MAHFLYPFVLLYCAQDISRHEVAGYRCRARLFRSPSCHLRRHASRAKVLERRSNKQTMVVQRSGSLLPVPRSEPAVTVASTDLPAEARGTDPCLDTGENLDVELATLDTQAETAQQLSPTLYRGLEQAEKPRSSLLSGLNPKAQSITPNMSSDDSSCETTPRTPGSDEPSPSGNAVNLDLWDPFSHESAAAAAARARQAAAAARATYKRVLGSQFVWLQTSYALSTMQAR